MQRRAEQILNFFPGRQLCVFYLVPLEQAGIAEVLELPPRPRSSPESHLLLTTGWGHQEPALYRGHATHGPFTDPRPFLKRNDLVKNVLSHGFVHGGPRAVDIDIARWGNTRPDARRGQSAVVQAPHLFARNRNENFAGLCHMALIIEGRHHGFALYDTTNQPPRESVSEVTTADGFEKHLVPFSVIVVLCGGCFPRLCGRSVAIAQRERGHAPEMLAPLFRRRGEAVVNDILETVLLQRLFDSHTVVRHDELVADEEFARMRDRDAHRLAFAGGLTPHDVASGFVAKRLRVQARVFTRQPERRHAVREHNADDE